MRRASLASLLNILVILGLTSCPETKVPREFGGKPLKLQSREWEGVWREAGSDEDLRFVVQDAAAGQITVFVYDKEKKTETAVEALAHEAPEKGEKLIFLTTFDEPGVAWGSINLVSAPEKGVLHSWNLRHDVVEAAVKSGELAGRLKPVKEEGDQKPHNHTQLSADPANYKKLTDARYWEWTKPSTLVRVVKK
jgi:hypothetical protein